ncbi:MAG: SpoIIE family protein phosphatase [Spirochaetales bacterium]|nr:SpoIIE family protein phosphatase [Leptospiraceae bacterium]MCP5481723.1 SpoIIE family protein phosphatase [Spirochaetales bacterium]
MRGLTLARINEITIRINSSEDLHGLLTVIMDTAREFLDSEASSLLLYDAESEELIFDIARGSHGGLLARRRIGAGQGIAGLCARDRQPILVNDAAHDARVLKNIDQELQFETRNLLAVPMLARGQLIGVLEVLNTSDRRDYDRTDVRLLTYLSNMAALAIRNRQLYEDLRERMEELNCIYEISQSARDRESIDSLMDSMLEAINRVLGAERLSIVVEGDFGSGLRVARTYGFSVEDHDRRIDPEEGVAGIVLRSGDPLLVRDFERDLRLTVPQSERYATKSFISVPIMQDGRVIGLLNAADKRNGEPFDSFELKVLSTVAQQFGDALMRIQARQKDIEIQIYRKDLETAAMIQESSLPLVPERVAGLELATRYEACREVGGDFYDVIYHSDDRISLLMADVAGKGVPAALFMEYSKTLLSGQIPRNLDPAGTLQQVNNDIYRNSRTGLFVTVMLIQVERELGRLRLASAGHNHQILVRARTGEIESLSARGAPLGIFPDQEYGELVVSYEPGDLVLLYTDGITEAWDEQFNEFGEERLFATVREHLNDSPRTLIDAVFEAVKAFCPGVEAADDATMLAVRL